MQNSEPLVLNIRVSDDRTDSLEIHQNDDVEKKVEQFCARNRIDEQQKATIYQIILQNLEDQSIPEEANEDGLEYEDIDLETQAQPVSPPVLDSQFSFKTPPQSHTQIQKRAFESIGKNSDSKKEWKKQSNVQHVESVDNEPMPNVPQTNQKSQIRNFPEFDKMDQDLTISDNIDSLSSRRNVPQMPVQIYENRALAVKKSGQTPQRDPLNDSQVLINSIQANNKKNNKRNEQNMSSQVVASSIPSKLTPSQISSVNPLDNSEFALTDKLSQTVN